MQFLLSWTHTDDCMPRVQKERRRRRARKGSREVGVVQEEPDKEGLDEAASSSSSGDEEVGSRKACLNIACEWDGRGQASAGACPQGAAEVALNVVH